MDLKKEVLAVTAWPDGSVVPPGSPPSSEGDASLPPAWELLYEGAYMPRRVRGSWRGGVLG